LTHGWRRELHSVAASRLGASLSSILYISGSVSFHTSVLPPLFSHPLRPYFLAGQWHS